MGGKYVKDLVKSASFKKYSSEIKLAALDEEK